MPSRLQQFALQAIVVLKMSLGAYAANGTMLAVVWNGDPYHMDVETRPIPTIVNQTDAIVRISSAAICGTDLHTYHGLYGSAEPGWIQGHEAVGYVDCIGSGVNYHAVGDYVVIPDNLGTGQLELQPGNGLTYGFGPDYTQGQHIGGCQAEYVRVPFADQSLIPIPKTNGTWNTSKELDYIMTSDIFATAWEGVTWSGFEAGDTVAVFGAGPVGQMAVYAATIRGASRVYVVDYVQERLDLAASVGAVPINFKASDPVEQLLSHEPLGVMRIVDAVGMEAENAEGVRQDGIVQQWAVDAAHIMGGIGTLGVYDIRNNATGRPLAGTLPQDIAWNFTTHYNKAVQWRIGSVDARQLAPQLIELISDGKASPGYIVSAQINITQAPEYYARFSAREETKVIIRF